MWSARGQRGAGGHGGELEPELTNGAEERESRAEERERNGEDEEEIGTALPSLS